MTGSGTRPEHVGMVGLSVFMDFIRFITTLSCDNHSQECSNHLASSSLNGNYLPNS
jgi:hypothetical protein